MYCRLIGLGAAGNKAAITAVENEIMSITQTMLINSTLKDIPADYQNKNGANVKQFVGAYGGCGKERNISFDLAQSNLMNNSLGLDEFLHIGQDDEAELVILVSSTEGGTGSGSVPLIAKFVKDVKGIPVHVFGIAGFEDDVRGMRNTVEFFKEMQPDFTVECIKNSKFLSSCNGNKIKAEKEANKEFCKKISVLMGLQIRDSEHNIDPTDLLKISTKTEGYMIIETCVFADKIKNSDYFRQCVIDTLDKSKALDVDSEAIERLGIIMNLKSESTDYIDYADIITERYGVPYEKYEHIQHEVETMPEFISFIMGGMKMPTEEVEATYENYQKSVARVNKSADDFFSTIKEKSISVDDKKFDFNAEKEKPKMSAADFFKQQATPAGSFKNTTTRMVSKEVDPMDEY